MGFIKNFNVVKLDKKGRIILPFHVRDYLGLKEGMEMLISNVEKNELKIFPLFRGKTINIKVMIEDKIGSLNKLLDVIEKNKVHILMSTSKMIEKGSLAEWSAIIDVSNIKDVKKMENDIRSLDITKKTFIEKK